LRDAKMIVKGGFIPRPLISHKGSRWIEHPRGELAGECKSVRGRAWIASPGWQYSAIVSKHVQTLEERLGVRLLNRTTRQVSPTGVGQNYYERCLRILADMEEADGAAVRPANRAAWPTQTDRVGVVWNALSCPCDRRFSRQISRRLDRLEPERFFRAIGDIGDDLAVAVIQVGGEMM
jgi:hypothetical protein